MEQKPAQASTATPTNDTPQIYNLGHHVDDRGEMVFFNEWYPSDVKRAYIIHHTRPDCIRAYHAHREEKKYLCAIKGTFKVVLFPMRDVTDQLKKTVLLDSRAGQVGKIEIILSDRNPQLLEVPKSWYHGFANLTPEGTLLVLSDKTLEESKNDDERLPYYFLGYAIFGVDYR